MVRPSCPPPEQSARAAGSERRPCGPGTFPPTWCGRRVRCRALRAWHERSHYNSFLRLLIYTSSAFPWTLGVSSVSALALQPRGSWARGDEVAASGFRRRRPAAPGLQGGAGSCGGRWGSAGRWGWSCWKELSVWWNRNPAVNTKDNVSGSPWVCAVGPARRRSAGQGWHLLSSLR